VSFDPLGELNWLAVVVAALAYYAVGAIWYARPVFGKVWSDAGGFALPERGEGPGPAIFVTPFVGSLVSAVALGTIAEATGTDTFAEGIALGLIAAVGFALSVSLVTAQFESQKPKPMVWGAVNAGYHMVGILIAAVILASWR
jgi:hypothetical protein